MNKYYYLVDELENDGMCFASIQEIKETAEVFDLKIDELTIFDTEMMPLKINAEHAIEMAIDGEDFFETFNTNSIEPEKIKELQDLLDSWCKEIDTNSYQRSKKLSVDEINKRLELENGN